MNERFFLAAWNSLSSEEQESFGAWAKASLEAEKAKRTFIKTYLSKELIQSQDEDFRIDLNTEGLEDFETFQKKLFSILVVVCFTPCPQCDSLPAGSKAKKQCMIDCFQSRLSSEQFDKLI